MKESDDSLAKSRGLPAEEELKYFKKAVVESLMNDASKILAHIELLSHGAEIEKEIHLLDHYLDHTRRLCESSKEEVGN